MTLKIGNKYIWTGNGQIFKCTDEDDSEYRLKAVDALVGGYLIAEKDSAPFKDLTPVIEVGFKFDYTNPFSKVTGEFEIIEDCGDEWRLKYETGIETNTPKTWLSGYLDRHVEPPKKKKPRCINPPSVVA